MSIEIKAIDPRIKRTRQLLQDAFFSLMSEKGFRAISVQDITERATVNRATFYAHFEDKYALLNSCIRESFQHQLASKLPKSDILTRNNLYLLILTAFDYMSQIHHSACSHSNKQQIDPIFEEAVQQEIDKVLLAWLQKMPVSTSYHQIPIDTLSTTISWAIFGAAIHWSHGSRTVSTQEMAEQVMQIAIGSISHTLQNPLLA